MDSQEILPYPDNMILLVEVGSTAHGTGIAGGEDHDETAVVIETPEQVFNTPGLKNKMERTQPEGSRSGPGDVDRQIYSLRNFISLCTAGNPSIQLVLYAPVIETTPLGKELRNQAHSFLGRHIIPKYRGYMKGQVMRMQGLKASGHGKRGGGKREELIAEHGYDCYLDDTEFLTRDGWKKYDDISEDVEVGTMNQKTGQFEFQTPTDRICKEYSGPIYTFKTRYTECAVTPNHRMFVSKVERGASNSLGSLYRPEVANWEFKRADELTNLAWHFLVTTEGSLEEYPVSDAYLAVIGAYVSEGCVAKRLNDGTPSVLSFSQNTDGRLIPYLEQIAAEFPTKTYKYDRQFEGRENVTKTTVTNLANREIATKIVHECGEYSAYKKLPRWVLELSKRQADFLLATIIAGDGTRYADNGHVYYTSSVKLAGDVQALAIVAGRRSNTWGPYDGMYQVFIQDESVKATSLYPRQSLNIEDVENRQIVCFTVPNETLLTRRNGRIAVHGNTKYAMHAARLGFQCIELLTERRLILPIQDEPGEWLRAVRRGVIEYEEWLGRVNKLDRILESMEKDTTIRANPDTDKIEKWVVSAHQRHWNW